MLRSFHILILLLLVLKSSANYSGNDSITAKEYKNRKIILAASSAAIAAGSLIYLSQAWYLQYDEGQFHTFNDNAEWLQMDKAGHMWSTYNTSRLMMDAFDWAGFNRKQKLMIGGTIGFAYMTVIEIMDGYSKGWGFSYGDMAANAVGCAAAITQEAFWNEQKIFIKYNYHKSDIDYASYNPSVLGKNLSENLLKDYNSQVYWVSCSPFAFAKKDSKLPKWFSIAIGYGASGMIRGHEDFITYTTSPNVQYTVEFERIRNFYLSVDLDLTKIKTKSKVLKTIFTCLNAVKIPAPALSFNKYGVTGYWFR